MGRMWYGHQYHRGGFFWPGLLFVGLFLLVFGKFLFPLLLLGFLVAPFIFWMKGRHGWHGHHRWAEKWKNDEMSEKPKRRYTQTADGEWVEIV